MAEELFKQPILLLDGGLGTTLEGEHGVRFSSTMPLWSSHLLLSAPETLLEVQENFARAGADVLLTATYQASFQGFRMTPQQPIEKHNHGSDIISLEKHGMYNSLIVSFTLSLSLGKEVFLPNTVHDMMEAHF